MMPKLPRPDPDTATEEEWEEFRKRIIARAERSLEEIEQYFLDVEHWNQLVRKPHERAIEPDPDGRMDASRKVCQQIIADLSEKGRRNQ